MENGNTGNKRKGFASMTPEQRREIASKGGKAAHASGHAHRFTSDEAVEAGRKGGRANGINQAMRRDREARGRKDAKL